MVKKLTSTDLGDGQLTDKTDENLSNLDESLLDAVVGGMDGAPDAGDERWWDEESYPI